MEFFGRLREDIAQGEREGLRRSLLEDNIRKGRTLAWVVIAFEACFAVMDTGAALLKVDGRFGYLLYLAMYLSMISMNAVFLLLTRGRRDQPRVSASAVTLRGRLLLAYITAMMCWGSAISLMDQRLYGQIIVFMVNMITCSVVFCMDNRQVLIPYACSAAILLAGLPFFQKSSDVLVGHYVNLGFFIIISWTASRIVYQRYCSDYRSRMLLVNANGQLEREIELNKAVNLLLSDANKQLRRLSLVDELTGIANRRGFRNFIDTTFPEPEGCGMTFCVVMMDMDFFKEYNDNYGHLEADRVLAIVAGQIQAVVRHDSDIAARWGGEEFVYAAFGLGADEAAEAAEQIRRQVYELHIPHEYSQAAPYVTLSLGCCAVEARDRSDISRCIEAADKAMYRAKAAGRNRTESAI